METLKTFPPVIQEYFRVTAQIKSLTDTRNEMKEDVRRALHEHDGEYELPELPPDMKQQYGDMIRLRLKNDVIIRPKYSNEHIFNTICYCLQHNLIHWLPKWKEEKVKQLWETIQKLSNNVEGTRQIISIIQQECLSCLSKEDVESIGGHVMKYMKETAPTQITYRIERLKARKRTRKRPKIA